MQNKLKLFSYFRSSTSQRVRIALNLKKLDYEYNAINLLQGYEESEEYTKINPDQRVPSLILEDGTILIESMAIIEYLDEVYPEPRLLPQDPIQRAKVRAFCELINSGMHPMQNLRILELVESIAPGYDKVDFVNRSLTRSFKALEKFVQTTHGKYTFGDQVSIADCFLVPQVLSGIARFKINLDDYPTLKSIYNNLKDLPEFYKAQPDQQPDFK